jgi:predicted nucleic acid-binding Zn ribbon protein
MTACLECGQPARKGGEFCSHVCNKTWHNRRLKRGAAIYDLVMAIRFDRANATLVQAWKAMTRLAAAYRDEDQFARGGRRTWRTPQSVLADKPWLKQEITDISPRAASRGKR